MGKRYIDADALYMDIIHRFDYCDDFLEMLESAPTADVRENIKGEWIKGGEQPYFRKHFDIVVCSVCNKRGEQRWNFCPNCGAYMRGNADETD